MKNIAIVTAGLMMASGGAFAGGVAQTPAQTPVYTPVATPAPVANWTGGYAGLSLGYGTVDLTGDVDNPLFDGEGEDEFLGFNNDADGVIGGVYGGYQYDFGSFVLGAEADLNAANIDFRDDSLFGDDDDAGDDVASIDQIHRLKLRGGYDAGNTLVYGTVGAAYAEAEVLGDDYSDTGYVVGAGVDYKFRPGVTVGGEVLYHDFSDFDDTGADIEAVTVQARVGYSF